METVYTELSIALFFLASLVLVAKFRKQISAVDGASYGHVAIGLSILSMVALAQLFYGLGALRSFPLVSDALFYRMVSWIGIITGTIFMLHGVSSWFPIARSNRQHDQARIKQLELLKKIQQLISVENRLPVVLTTSLEYINAALPLSHGAVYAWPPAEGTPRLLATSGLSVEDESDLQSVQFDREQTLRYVEGKAVDTDELVRRLPVGQGYPEIVLPVVAEGLPVAMFLLWPESISESEHDILVNLKIVAEIISRKVTGAVMSQRDEFFVSRESWRIELQDTVDDRKSLKDNFVRIVRTIRKMIPTDHASLTMIRPAGMIDRFTVGQSDTLLSEVGLGMRSAGTVVSQMLREAGPIRIDDMTYAGSTVVEETLVDGGLRSLLAVPLSRGNEVQGVLTLASDQAGSYGARERSTLSMVVPILTRLLEDEEAHAEAVIQEQRIGVVNEFITEIGRLKDLSSAFQRAAEILSSQLKTSMVRISTYEYDGAFMKSRAFCILRPTEHVTPPDGHMVLSLMPFHKLVRDSGRLALIDRTGPDHQISDAEAQQAFGPSVESVLLVPVKVGEQVLAVIGLGEERCRKSTPYSQTDIRFVTSIAAVLSAAIQVGLNTRRVERTAAELHQSEEGLGADTRSRIKSSLSGILGSSELIRLHAGSSDEKTEQYLSIIDQSARQITEYCETSL